MSILITGCAGFIGSHLAEELLRRGRSVVGLDNFNTAYPPAVKERNIKACLERNNFTLVRGDIRDAKLLNKIFAKHRPGSVIHLAARAGVRASLKQPAVYLENNVTGTARLLEAARRNRVRHFIFASSSSVYGSDTRPPFRETARAERQLSPYGASKRAGELLCQTYNHLYSLPVTALRFFTVYGPRQRPEMAVANFTSRLQRGEPITVFGDPNRTGRDYTYIDDIINGIMAVLKRPLTKRPFRVYNLGSSSPITLKKLITLIEGACRKKARLNQKPFQAGDLRLTWAAITKAKKELAWKPRVKIGEGITRYVEWLNQFQI